MPWYPSYPKKEPYFCNAIDNNQIFNRHCAEKMRSICAKGGNHCGSTSDTLSKPFHLPFIYTNTISGPKAVCPQGWKEMDGSCYFFSTDKINWVAAEAKCQELNKDAHLLSCSTRKEVDFAMATANRFGTYWLGVSDL